MTRNSENLGSILSTEIPASHIAILDLGKNDTRRFVTYGQLDGMANAVARGLDRLGLAPGSVIAIDVENGAEHLAILFGAQRAGHVVLPVNYKLAESGLRFILEDSATELAFVRAERARCYPPTMHTIVLGRESADADGDRFEDFLDWDGFEHVEVGWTDPAELLYTAGSTGQPKGVLLSHASHLWVLRTRLRDLTMMGERVLVAAPFFHMQGLTMSQLVLAGGGTLIVMPRFDAISYISAIDLYRPTWLTGVPPMMSMILRERHLIDRTDRSCVTTIRLGSAPVSRSLLTELTGTFPGARIINGYGTTESGPVAFGPHPDGVPTPDGSAGYPHREVDIRFSQSGAEQGELEIRSPGSMIGYLRRPDLAHAVTEDGFYRTGDIFAKDGNGFYYFVSRADDMMTCGGENIYPSEVEKALESMSGVSQASVVAVPDEIKGEKPVAFVVLEPGADIDATTLQQQFFAIAPPYQYPRRIWFLDSMPVTAANKRDRQELVRRATSLVQA